MTNLIKVDFRKEKLAIDDDLYLKNVVEIHCRKCERRKPRKNAIEIKETWGYICNNCQQQLKSDVNQDSETEKTQENRVTYITAR